MTSLPREIPINIETEMKNSYISYAMSVIISRALPDARDGLKPVHRRVLFSMHELKNLPNQPYKKSARVVGDTIGKYHPHGDSAVYDTIVRMAQPFSLRYPLVDGQGNFGSVDGDAAAAMRYTEIRLEKITLELLNDLDKDTVDFGPNYDNSEREPLVMPAKIPTLLVNGSSGIAVGMATNIPPHNLNEVVTATIAQIHNPDITLEEIMSFIPGPDFPTAGFIFGKEGINSAYATGRGIIKMRARAVVETDSRTNKQTIAVTELPYQVNKARLLENIADHVRQKRLEGISDLRDESDRDGMRMVIELKRDAVPGVVMNKLFKLTQMQSSFGIIMLALVNGQPRTLPLKGLIQVFIDHRRDVVSRRTAFELRKAKAREHILQGLKIALDNIEAVVETIRKSRAPAEARENLMSRFSLSEKQAQAILDMRLQRLTNLESTKIIDELKLLKVEIKRLTEILADEGILLAEIVKELEYVRDRYNDDRRTEIIPDAKELSVEDMIVEEDMVVTVSHSGYVKRNSISLYRAQRRGGKGKKGMGTKAEDFVSNLFIASTHDYMLVFSTKGQLYWVKVHEIPQGGRAARGKAIVNLVNMSADEQIAAILPVTEFSEDKFIIFATKKGVVKKTQLVAYSNVRTNGIKAILIDEEDEIISVKLTDGKQHVLLSTKNGKAIRFEESDVRPTGRATRGMKGIELSAGDDVVSMEVLTEGATILSVTEKGKGKRSKLDDYRIQRRGGRGIITIKTTERNGNVANVLQVVDDDDVMLITNSGIIIRMKTKGVKVIGRNTQGVNLIRVAPGEHVVKAVRLAEADESDDSGVDENVIQDTEQVELPRDVKDED